MKRLLTALLLFIFNGVAAASPATPEVVRYDRYLLVSTSPQQPPLEQLTALSVPPGFHPTIGEALQYLLRDSGWSLCLADARRAQLYGLPLPLSQYNTGPLRLKSALQLLAGPAWRMTSDENHREVGFASDHYPPPGGGLPSSRVSPPFGAINGPVFFSPGPYSVVISAWRLSCRQRPFTSIRWCGCAGESSGAVGSWSGLMSAGLYSVTANVS